MQGTWAGLLKVYWILTHKERNPNTERMIHRRIYNLDRTNEDGPWRRKEKEKPMEGQKYP